MAYSSIENKYLSALTAVQFPDAPIEPAMPEQTMPGTRPGDVQVAEVGATKMPDYGYSGQRQATMTDYDPTVRERMAEFLQAGFEKFGMDRYRARQQAQTLIGGPSSNLPLNIGLADVVPFLGTGLQTQEAVRTGEEAVTSAQQGNYGTAAVQGGAAVLGLVPGVAGTVKAAKPLLPKAGEMVIDTMQKLGTPIIMPAVPLENFSKVITNSAAKVDRGTVKLSDKVSKKVDLQLAPEYRVKVIGAYKPEGKTQNITNAVNPGNYEDVSIRLDDLAQAFPDPLESPEKFSTMMATVYNSNEVPIPPTWLIENANDMGKWTNWFGSMTQNQIDEAARGFAVVDKFKKIYTDGTANVDTTGRLMMWAMLSRRASAYPHESGFLDLADKMTPLIQKAARGEFTDADIEAGLQLVKATIPEGSPGKSVTSNANDFVRIFLPKMAADAGDGRSKLQALHDMIADQNMTGPQIRRAFYGLAEDVGIKNKVLSFALLVSGRNDVMVLDRIQINRLFAGGEKIYDDVAHIFDGGPGLAIYEGLERSLAPRIQQLYDGVGRGDQASIGRYHWESWVLSSGQEVAHPTLDTIVKAAKGETAPYANVPVMEGRTHKTSYGVTYERLPEGGNQFVYTSSNGSKYSMTKPQLDEMFTTAMKGKDKAVPNDFPGVNFFEKDTLPDGKPNPYFGKPWFSWPGVNRERIDQLAETLGTRLNASSGGQPVAGAGKRTTADGSVGTAGKRTSVKQSRQALQSGAE